MAVVPIVIGPLRAVSDMFEKYMGKLDVTIRLEVIQKTALLGTAEEGFVPGVLSVGTRERTLGPIGTCCCLLPRK